jgi:hypothetical protein
MRYLQRDCLVDSRQVLEALGAAVAA